MSRKLHDHDAILKDWLAGMTVKEIAAKHGCPGNLGALIAKKHGVKRSPKITKLANKRRGQISNETVANTPERIRLRRLHQRIADYTKRHGTAAAAVKFGYGRGSVRAIANRHGWTRPPFKFNRDAILKDYLAGMPLAKIVEKHGCNPSYPATLAKRAGKKRRSIRQIKTPAVRP